MNNNNMDSIQMPNRLIFSPQTYEKMEKKLLYLSLHFIKQKQIPDKQLKLFNEDSLDPLEGIEYIEKERTVIIPYSLASANGEWRSFIEASKSFEKRSINFTYINPENKEDRFDRTINLVEECTRHKGVGIKIIFTNRGYKVLTHLSKNYSKIPLEYALKLSSKYSQRIYELLLSRCFGAASGSWSVSLEKFRELLGIEYDKYLHWGSFEKATLLMMKKELEQKDPLGNRIIPMTFDYVTIKKQRKVVGLKFDVTILDSKTYQLSVFPLDERQQQAMNRLTALMVAEKYRHTIATEYTDEFFQWQYAVNMRKNKLTNPAGHLLKTLGLV